MKQLFCFFLTLFSIYTVLGQDKTFETKADIIKALKEVPTTPFESLQEKEKLLFLLKEKSREIGYKEGILQSGDVLMRNYSLQGKYKEVIQIGNEMKKILQDEKNIGLIANIYRSNALALGYLGLHEASLKDFKTAVNYAEKIKNKNLGFYYISLCYENMTGYYQNKLYINQESDNTAYKDSIVYYLEKSLGAVKQVKDNNGMVSNDFKYDHIAFVDIRLGIFYLEQSELAKAEKHLLEGYKIHQNKAYNIPAYNKIFLLNQLSWLYLEKKEYQKSIEYAELALQLEKQYSSPDNRVESFEFLTNSYTGAGQKEKAAFYLREFSQLKDSIRFADRNNADTAMVTIITDIKDDHEKNLQKLSVYVLIIALIVAIIIFILWKRKKRIIYKKYEELIAKINAEKVADNTKKISSNILLKREIKSNITDETIKILLDKLIQFEKTHKYLRKDISRPWLADHLNTNTKYMTDVIKIRSNTTYTNYIHRLKISYITRKLVEDPLYRQYKIEYLAEECGYASRQVFISAFKNETGLTPSYFIENLKKN